MGYGVSGEEMESLANIWNVDECARRGVREINPLAGSYPEDLGREVC